MVKIKLVIYLLAIVTACTLVTTYTMNKYLGHQTQTIPFISESINRAPESCIGTLGLSIASFLMIVIIYIKYSITKFGINNNPYIEGWSDSWNDNRKAKTNKSLFIIGVISAISLDGVASFQYSNAPIPHLIFATLFFLCGVIYVILQTFLDSLIRINPVGVMRFRKLVCAFSVCTFFPYLILQFVHKGISSDLSALFEILSASSLFFYFVTYYYEFSQFGLKIDFHYISNESKPIMS